jgi:hypothetical protein
MKKSAALFFTLLIACAAQSGRPQATKEKAQVTCATCPVASVQPTATHAFAAADTSHGCKIGTRNGLPIPDPACTPGAFNPSVTLLVLKNPNFRTHCVRDCITTEARKSATYQLYGVPHPSNNTDQNQTCELDHLVPLELGGADSLDNIWPQCGPNNVPLEQRYFKQKDMVENYLADQARNGKMGLAKAQSAIAHDWTQFLSAAKTFCAANPGACKGEM